MVQGDVSCPETKHASGLSRWYSDAGAQRSYLKQPRQPTRKCILVTPSPSAPNYKLSRARFGSLDATLLTGSSHHFHPLQVLRRALETVFVWAERGDAGGAGEDRGGSRPPADSSGSGRGVLSRLPPDWWREGGGAVAARMQAERRSLLRKRRVTWTVTRAMEAEQRRRRLCGPLPPRARRGGGHRSPCASGLDVVVVVGGGDSLPSVFTKPRTLAEAPIGAWSMPASPLPGTKGACS